MTLGYCFGYLWFPCPCTMPAYRQMCAVLEGFISVALHPDTKKTFKWCQKAGVKGYMFCPSSPSDHYSEIYVNRLVKYSPLRLQDPSLLYEGN